MIDVNGEHLIEDLLGDLASQDKPDHGIVLLVACAGSITTRVTPRLCRNLGLATSVIPSLPMLDPSADWRTPTLTFGAAGIEGPFWLLADISGPLRECPLCPHVWTSRSRPSMSAFGGKAGVNHRLPERPLISQERSSSYDGCPPIPYIRAVG